MLLECIWIISNIFSVVTWIDFLLPLKIYFQFSFHLFEYSKSTLFTDLLNVILIKCGQKIITNFKDQKKFQKEEIVIPWHALSSSVDVEKLSVNPCYSQLCLFHWSAECFPALKFVKISHKKQTVPVPVTHAYNPSYLGRDQ
jgi:hypothetical protein